MKELLCHVEVKEKGKLDITKVIKGFVHKSRIYALESTSISDCSQQNFVKKKKRGGGRSKF